MHRSTTPTCRRTRRRSAICSVISTSKMTTATGTEPHDRHAAASRVALFGSADALAARSALTRGDLTAAEGLCARAAAADPAQGWAWLLLAETALLRERADGAIKCAERAVAL